MLFNSELFLFVFLPAVLAGFHALGRWAPGAAQGWWLIVASFVFYASWNPLFLTLLGGSVVGNYLIALLLNRHRTRTMLAVGVTANLAVLAYFKYANFFLDVARDAGASGLPILDVVLPLGISFFTFQQIAFLCDVRAGLVKDMGFRNYALFICFFPQLVAGPIVHHCDVIHQFDRMGARPIDPRMPAAGLTLLLIGLFKKTVIAADLATVADPLFDQARFGEALTATEGWLAALAFGFQIYFDFSAYSDMAIGIGLMVGVVLPINFFAPYQATSIVDFWRRWHITLSRFLKDYLYVPLGGNRRGPTRRYINLMAVMLLGGLWHGAGWTFVLWGGLHGLALALAHLWRTVRPATDPSRKRGRAVTVLGWAATMLLVFWAWVPFRADGFAETWTIWQGMAGMHGLGAMPSFDDVSSVLAAAAICLLLPPAARQFRDVLGPSSLPSRGGWIEQILSWRPTRAWAAAAGLLGFIGVLQIWQSAAFIYFQF